MLLFAAMCRETESEMEGEDRELTARQQAYFEHVRQAKEQGLSLTGYCQKLGLDVRSLYGVRRDLVERGILPRTLAPRRKSSRPNKFVAVQVMPSGPSGPSGGEPVCRVRHPSGWTIECSGWPEAGWVSALLKGGADATG